MTDLTDPDDRAWFRSHVDRILEVDPVDDAWASIESRAAREPTVIASAPSRPARRWFAAAAVIVLLAGLAVVVALGRGGDEGSVVTGAPGATGWYVPVGLPEGWQLIGATIVPGSPCDASSQRWKATPDAAAGDGSRPAIELSYRSCAPMPDDAGAPGPSIGPRSAPSFVAAVEAEPSQQVVRWEDHGLWELTGEGITGGRLLDAAQAIAADPTATEPPLPELASTSAGASRYDDPTGPPSVTLDIRSPSGASIHYLLVESGHGPRLTPFTSDRDGSLPDQPLGLRRRGSIPLERFSRGAGPGDGYLFGAWPGADVVIGERAVPDPSDDAEPTPAEARAAVGALASSLRPASTASWRDFLATAEVPVDARLLSAPSLADLDAPRQGTTETTPPGSVTTPAPPATSTTTTTGPTPGETPGSVVSGPGAFTKREATYESFTPIEDLDVRLELSSDTVRAGQPVTATLIMRNPTDEAIEFNECSRGLSRWGLVSASTPDRDPPDHNIIDCYANAPNIGPHQTVRFPVDWVRPAGFLAQRRGSSLRWWEYGATLPGGDYLAVMIIPGQTGELRLSIPVTVPDPPCETTDADVGAYVRHSLEGAKAVARERGDEIRLASIDGKPEPRPDDLRCDRINIDIDGDVVNAVRY
jgi:hypothetical protein